jgi:hypothetical protein
MKKGLCAKQVVVAVIANNGKLYYGSNWCVTPQSRCPRAGLPSGQGYELCKTICQQHAHAEIDVCREAGKDCSGAILQLFGHTYCCDECKDFMKKMGVAGIKIGDTTTLL